MPETAEADPQDAPSDELLEFFLPLHRAFEPRRRLLLDARRQSLENAHRGSLPGYLPESKAIKGAWSLTVPEWAKDQRNQITGPADNATQIKNVAVAMATTTITK